MSKLDNFLGALSKVKKNGKDYIACCPAHNDKSPSMGVKETDDGRLLVHCFAGCSVEEIVSSIGFKLSDLMPDNPTYQRRKPSAVPFNSRDVLACIRSDCYLLGVYISDIGKGKELTDAEVTGALQAAGRIITAADMAGA